jgi:small subunit ribosomal protein S3
MDAGALGAEIVLSGKVTGARSRVEKFNRGYIKHNGEPAQEIVDEGQGVAVMKLGTIGVTVKIIPPNAHLPDDFDIREGVEVEPVEQAAATEEGVEELLEEEPEAIPEVAQPDAEAEAGEAPVEDVEEVVDEEVVEEPAAGADEADADEGEGDDDGEAAGAEPDFDDLDEDVEAEAASLVAEMEGDEEDD